MHIVIRLRVRNNYSWMVLFFMTRVPMRDIKDGSTIIHTGMVGMICLINLKSLI